MSIIQLSLYFLCDLQKGKVQPSNLNEEMNAIHIRSRAYDVFHSYKERFNGKWKGLNKRTEGFVGWPVSVLLAMAASSTNGIIDLLEKFLKILKDEHALDRSGDQPVIQFHHPEDLQVNNNSIFCISCHAKVSNILTCHHKKYFLKLFHVLIYFSSNIIYIMLCFYIMLHYIFLLH